MADGLQRLMRHHRVRGLLVLTLVLMMAAPAARAAPAEPNATPDAAQAEAPAAAEKEGPPPGPPEICKLIKANADVAGMSPAFFARLIWKESRFDSKAVSPVGAQGIAQFMPYTAKERGLADPYDLEEAIRHSALYLADLKSELGNWGLAAAAYNGGINRVKGWMASGGSLPFETEDYVLSITARSADWFLDDGHEVEERPLEEGKDFQEACERLPVVKTRALVASAPMQPWGVQVAGNFRQDVAMRIYRATAQRYPSVLGGRDPIVMRARNGIGRRSIYAVRIGADSRAEADALCGKLKAAGGACVVYKN
ncbi:lytic transglycosylase domain-containing protein [Consotaella salsifontis]|uniref:Sporulation related domain-containing protein n=1 Tax=Consotaella salsifontis TaxID=1365950 RepID=A0A1T4SQV6_9HYPH|nr:lytic transglycosylase domain-containing protein [Consotaella salsifontis]SKA30572.1 Sporulation related domain-containing protein [Consotaella salsifontis]